VRSAQTTLKFDAKLVAFDGLSMGFSKESSHS